MAAIHDANETRKQRAFAPLLAVFGVLFIVVGILAAKQPLHLKRAGVSAPGVVVKLVDRPARKGGSTQHAVVRFFASTADPVQFEDRTGTSPPMYRVDETVRVLYLAESPASSAIIDRGVWNLLPTFFFVAFGLICTALGLSMGLQRPSTGAVVASAPAGVAVALRAMPDAAAGGPASAREADAGPRHPRLWAIALAIVALALIIAGPRHITGNAAIGVLLCVLAGLVAAFGMVVNLVAGVVFAGLRTAVAAASGTRRGLDADAPAAAWSAAADDSPRLRAALLRYAHFKRALWASGMFLLVIGVALMGIELLTHSGTVAH